MASYDDSPGARARRAAERNRTISNLLRERCEVLGAIVPPSATLDQLAEIYQRAVKAALVMKGIRPGVAVTLPTRQGAAVVGAVGATTTRHVMVVLAFPHHEGPHDAFDVWQTATVQPPQ